MRYGVDDNDDAALTVHSTPQLYDYEQSKTSPDFVRCYLLILVH